MSWSYVFCDTRTGVKQLSAVPFEGPWSKALNGNGLGSNKFLLSDATNAELPWRDLTTPWGRTLVKCWNGAPAYAGIIYHRGFDWDTQVWTIQHATFRSLLAHRTTLGENGYAVGPGGETHELNKELRAIAGRLVWIANEGPTPNYSLPVEWVDASLVGTDSRSYYDYNLVTTEAGLRELQDVDGGPDIDFEPQWSDAGTLKWVMRSGTDAAPKLSGGTTDWYMNVKERKLFNVSFAEDASQQATSVLAVGKGSEADMKVAYARVDSSLPALERIEPYKDIDDQNILQSHADADLATFKSPTEQWSASMLAENLPMQLGSTMRLYFKGDPGASDGWHDLRVIGLSGDTSETVRVSLQPKGV